MNMTDKAVRLYVKVDTSKCCGYSACSGICPELYKLDEQGFAYVESNVVPLGLEEKAQKGAFLCPEHAIYVGETRPN